LGGRFYGDRIPFGSIEAIRGEVMEIDEADEAELVD
jgi:hypothetical protein